MREETKLIDPAALAGITTGILMTEFSLLHEALEWVMGRPIWTHELPRVSDTATALILEQFPEMPTEILGHWSEARDNVWKRFGQKVAVRQGNTERAAGPVEALVEMMNAGAPNE